MTKARAWPGMTLFCVAVLVGSIMTLRAEVTSEMLTPFVVVAALAMIAGELVPMRLSQRTIAPLTTAPALGLIVAPVTFGEAPSAATALAIVWLSILIGGILSRLSGRSVVEGSLGARFLGMAITAWLARGLHVDGRTVLERVFAADVAPETTALVLLGVAAVGGLVERFLEALVAWLEVGGRWTHFATQEVGPLAGIFAATISSAPLIALAYPVIDWAAIPLFVLPVVLTHIAVRRLIGIRRALGEATRALSRLTEVTGCGRTGHPRRVAAISLELGQMLGMEADELRLLEYAALLHDIGQLGLTEPLEGGVTLHASSEVQEEIAHAAAWILQESDGLKEVLPLVDQVRTPFRQSREYGENIPLASRIVRVANAWDDITEGSRAPRSREVALERLHLGLGYDYDPEIVATLERAIAASRQATP